jgi:uridine phosphorylase
MNDQQQDDSIVKPGKAKGAPDLGPVAVMVSNQEDLNALRWQLDLGQDHVRNLFMSRLIVGKDLQKDLAVAGPIIGAPYATMVLETLVAWGVRKIIYFGWCGAVSKKVKIGDIIVATGAVIDEGTSRHYNANGHDLAYPSGQILEKTKNAFRDHDLSFHAGLVWSTDAIYRETREKVEHFQQKGVLAVEMELSALFTVGSFRNVEVTGILVVSDELSTYKWRTGFKAKDFKKARRATVEVISTLCQSI